MPLVLFGGGKMKMEGAYVALGSAFSSGLVPRSFLHHILWYHYDKTSGRSRGKMPGILHHVTRSVNKSVTVQQIGVHIDTDSHLLEVFAVQQYIPASILLLIQQVGYNCDIFPSLRATRKNMLIPTTQRMKIC